MWLSQQTSFKQLSRLELIHFNFATISVLDKYKMAMGENVVFLLLRIRFITLIGGGKLASARHACA